MIQLYPTRQGTTFKVEAAKYGYGWKFTHWALGRGGHYPENPQIPISLTGRPNYIDLPDITLGPIELNDSQLLIQYDPERDTPYNKIILEDLEALAVGTGEVSNFGVYLTHLTDPIDPEFVPVRLLYGLANFPLGIWSRLDIEILP